MAISRWATQLGGDLIQPALGRDPRAWGCSKLSGHFGGPGSAIRAQNQSAAGVMVIIEGERYLVSMLGAEADWVQNLRAAGGDITLPRSGRYAEARLEEIDRGPARARAEGLLEAGVRHERRTCPLTRMRRFLSSSGCPRSSQYFKSVSRSTGHMSAEQSLPPGRTNSAHQ